MARYASCTRCSLGSAEADFGKRGLEGAEEGLVGGGVYGINVVYVYETGGGRERIPRVPEGARIERVELQVWSATRTRARTLPIRRRPC